MQNNPMARIGGSAGEDLAAGSLMLGGAVVFESQGNYQTAVEALWLARAACMRAADKIDDLIKNCKAEEAKTSANKSQD